MKKLPVSPKRADMWVLSTDRRTVRFNLPPVPFAGHAIARPLALHLDSDAASIDEMIERLVALRSQMLPARQWKEPR